MLTLFIILSFIFGGFSYQAQSQDDKDNPPPAPLTVSVADTLKNGGSRDKGDCPFADGGVIITAQHDSKTSGEVTLTINCAPDKKDAKKTNYYTAKEMLNATGAATYKEIPLAENNMIKGLPLHC